MGSRGGLNSKQSRTLKAIFAKPTRSDLAWRDVETVFRALGASIKEGRGSRVGVELKCEEAVFHRPRPGPAMSKGSVEAARDFLARAGVIDPWSIAATPPGQ